MAPHDDSKATCPYCGTSETARVLYGYPLGDDFALGRIYATDAPDVGSPTHCCWACEKIWFEPGCAPLYFAFPDTCYYCGQVTSDAEKLRFQTAYEDWLYKGHGMFALESPTFMDNPFPVCGGCRESIHGNQQDLETEEKYQDAVVRFTSRVVIVCAVIVAIVIAIGLIVENY